jgi:hypothetical protein
MAQSSQPSQFVLDHGYKYAFFLCEHQNFELFKKFYSAILAQKSMVDNFPLDRIATRKGTSNITIKFSDQEKTFNVEHKYRVCNVEVDFPYEDNVYNAVVKFMSDALMECRDGDCLTYLHNVEEEIKFLILVDKFDVDLKDSPVVFPRDIDENLKNEFLMKFENMSEEEKMAGALELEEEEEEMENRLEAGRRQIELMTLQTEAAYRDIAESLNIRRNTTDTPDSNKNSTPLNKTIKCPTCRNNATEKLKLFIENQECAVCMDKKANIALNCGHVVCNECIERL